MERNNIIERGIFVFCNWLVFGLICIGFTLEGGARGDFLVGLIGIAGIVGGFVCHVIINKAFSSTFTVGEVTLGLGLFALGSLAFILSWITGQLSYAAFLNGLTLLAVMVLGFLAYVTTRHGLGGAFKKFDVVASSNSGHRK